MAVYLGVSVLILLALVVVTVGVALLLTPDGRAASSPPSPSPSPSPSPAPTGSPFRDQGREVEEVAEDRGPGWRGSRLENCPACHGVKSSAGIDRKYCGGCAAKAGAHLHAKCIWCSFAWEERVADEGAVAGIVDGRVTP